MLKAATTPAREVRLLLLLDIIKKVRSAEISQECIFVCEER